MGIAGSKDETGKYVLGASKMPPGFMDAKGIELRDKLDICLEKNMYYFTIAGLAITVPICIKYRTERPFFVAAVLCPVADMYYGTLRCTEENEAFRLHYRQMEQAFQQPISQRQQRLEQELAEHRWRPHDEQEEQQAQQKRWWKPW